MHTALTAELGQTMDPVALAAWSARPTDTEVPGIHHARREAAAAPLSPPT
ncbi:hypothetical protein [Streptomyces sp. NPDC017524]